MHGTLQARSPPALAPSARRRRKRADVRARLFGRNRRNEGEAQAKQDSEASPGAAEAPNPGLYDDVIDEIVMDVQHRVLGGGITSDGAHQAKHQAPATTRRPQPASVPQPAKPSAPDTSTAMAAAEDTTDLVDSAVHRMGDQSRDRPADSRTELRMGPKSTQVDNMQYTAAVRDSPAVLRDVAMAGFRPAPVPVSKAESATFIPFPTAALLSVFIMAAIRLSRLRVDAERHDVHRLRRLVHQLRVQSEAQAGSSPAADPATTARIQQARRQAAEAAAREQERRKEAASAAAAEAARLNEERRRAREEYEAAEAREAAQLAEHQAEAERKAAERVEHRLQEAAQKAAAVIAAAEARAREAGERAAAAQAAAAEAAAAEKAERAALLNQRVPLVVDVDGLAQLHRAPPALMTSRKDQPSVAAALDLEVELSVSVSGGGSSAEPVSVRLAEGVVSGLDVQDRALVLAGRLANSAWRQSAQSAAQCWRPLLQLQPGEAPPAAATQQSSATGERTTPEPPPGDGGHVMGSKEPEAAAQQAQAGAADKRRPADTPGAAEPVQEGDALSPGSEVSEHVRYVGRLFVACLQAGLASALKELGSSVDGATGEPPAGVEELVQVDFSYGSLPVEHPRSPMQHIRGPSAAPPPAPSAAAASAGVPVDAQPFFEDLTASELNPSAVLHRRLDTVLKDEGAELTSQVQAAAGGRVQCGGLYPALLAAAAVDVGAGDGSGSTQPESSTADAAPAGKVLAEEHEQRVLAWLQEQLPSSGSGEGVEDTAQLLRNVLGDTHPVAMRVEHATAGLPRCRGAAKQAASRRTRVAAEYAAVMLAAYRSARRSESADRREGAGSAGTGTDAAADALMVWSLRTVAAELACGDARARGEAAEYLEAALEVQEAALGDPKHPGLLDLLWRLAIVKSMDESASADVVPLAERCLDIIEAVQQRYQKADDLPSAVALAEAACVALERFLRYSHPRMQRLSRSAETLFTALLENEKTQVLARRRLGNGVEKLAALYLEPPDVNTPGRCLDWDRGLKPPSFV